MNGSALSGIASADGIAPADSRPHRAWGILRAVAAYLTLLALAIASIWFIDRRVDALANQAAPRPSSTD